MDSTQQAPAAVARRSFDVLVSALQEATCVFVARVRGGCPVDAATAAMTPGEALPPNRDYFQAATGNQ